jgi:pimeloyl-ACP methyl ester carboxylesterase
MEVRSAYTRLPDVRLYFEEAGRGFPLVMLHPASGDLRLWDEQFLTFAREYRTLRYDLRGFGRSDTGSGYYAHARDLRHLLQALEIERAFILGCALGASSAIDFAIEYPDAAAGLVLVNPALAGFSYETPQGPVDLLPVGERTLPPLNVIRCPVMVITGEMENTALTAAQTLITRALPAAKKAQLAGTALLPNVGRPVQFNRIVLTFLEWARKEALPNEAEARANPL